MRQRSQPASVASAVESFEFNRWCWSVSTILAFLLQFERNHNHHITALPVEKLKRGESLGVELYIIFTSADGSAGNKDNSGCVTDHWCEFFIFILLCWLFRHVVTCFMVGYFVMQLLVSWCHVPGGSLRLLLSDEHCCQQASHEGIIQVGFSNGSSSSCHQASWRLQRMFTSTGESSNQLLNRDIDPFLNGSDCERNDTWVSQRIVLGPNISSWMLQ